MRLSDWTVIRMKCGGTHILLAPLVRWLHGGTEGVPYLCHRYSFPQRDIRLSQNSTACPIKTQYHTSICFTATHNIVPRLKLQRSIRTKSNGGGCKRNFHHSGSVTYLPSPFISYRKLTPATNAPFSFPFSFSDCVSCPVLLTRHITIPVLYRAPPITTTTSITTITSTVEYDIAQETRVRRCPRYYEWDLRGNAKQHSTICITVWRISLFLDGISEKKKDVGSCLR